MVVLFGPTLQKIGEQIGPIILRELAKPRTRQFIEEKVGDVAIELARGRFTKKAKKEIIIRRGKHQFKCRRIS